MTNILYTGDNLYILHGMNSNSVDLIYLDPPFNSKRMYSAPVGSKAAGSSFKDMWSWSDVDTFYLERLSQDYPGLVRFIESISFTHSKAMMAYVTYMTQRIIELHRILKDTGSFYLHCDQTASHYLKIALDQIFGRKHFITEIIWSYSWGSRTDKRWNRKHDVILMYTKTENYTFNAKDVMEERRLGEASKNRLKYEGALIGVNKKGMQEFALPTDVWDIPTINAMAKERTGYPTQKPLALLKKIILASSNPGDIVLDPFCGCATTCVAAEQLPYKRKWIGIDVSEMAVKLVMERLSDEEGELFKNFINLDKPGQRTDIEILEITPQTKNDIRKHLFEQQKGICNGCQEIFDIRHFEVDHIVPKAKGGGDYMENYQLLCSSCNRIKGARPMEYLRMKIEARERVLRTQIKFGE